MTDIRTGFGYDIHRLVEGEYLLLGRVRIPADKMIDAHSDGDIVLHSLAQAIFSSLGLEDIGTYFPDNSGSGKTQTDKRSVHEKDLFLFKE